ncbi:MAG: GxxExxY protein [Opitutaceae bacterium]|jgi:GxxExxY protein|nr:GxxExxY protein [Opitutaceae bacterium]
MAHEAPGARSRSQSRRVAHETHEMTRKKNHRISVFFFVSFRVFRGYFAFMKTPEKDIVLANESYRIIGTCFEVYKEKGCGFLEAVFQECMEMELELQGIPFEAQKVLPLSYKGRPLKQTYKADIVCFDKVLVELKAVSEITNEHRAQVINYLNATGLKLGLLVNFGHYPKLQWERLVV